MGDFIDEVVAERGPEFALKVAEAELRREREKVAALRALLADCETYLVDCKRDWGNNDLIERIRKELGK